MIQRSTIYFVIVLLTFGVGAAGVYVYWQLTDNNLDGYYTVADSFTDTTGTVYVKVDFVEVTGYDSLKVLKVAELLTRQSVEQNELNGKKEREYLYHFFVNGDTAMLTTRNTEELAYTHPGIAEPSKKLLSVPGGWVVRATFAPSMIQPRMVEAKRSEFYMPRKGIQAKTLR